MDNCGQFDPYSGRIGTNGIGTSGNDLNRHGQSNDYGDPKRHRNYRLIIDPVLKQGPKKVYSYNGVVLGEAMPVVVRDPRSRVSRSWCKKEAANLPVPNFKYDQYYVGAILPKEVTFCNLNNNVNQAFLRDMCKGCGNIEDVVIYYHPKNKRHLGIGMVLFMSTKAAKLCAEKFNQTTTMGNMMTVFVDTMGQERTKLIEAATTEKSAVGQPLSPKSKPPVDILGQHLTPVDDFRSPKKTLDPWTPGANSLDPRSLRLSEHKSSLSSPATRDWNRSSSSLTDLGSGLGVVEMSPFRDLKYVPPLPSDQGYSDSVPLPPPPPLPSGPYPYDSFSSYDPGASQANVTGVYVNQDYCSSTRDNQRDRFDRCGRSKRVNNWDSQRDNQQRWESHWKTPLYDCNNEALGGLQVENGSVIGHELLCNGGWESYHGENALTTSDNTMVPNDNAQPFAIVNAPKFTETDDDEEEKESTKLPQSLESRIQAMLAQGGAMPFMQLQTDDEVNSPQQPPGTKDHLNPLSNCMTRTPPPLPPPEDEPLPPPLPADDLPPLPPEPDFANTTPVALENSCFCMSEKENNQQVEELGLNATLDSETNGVTFSVGNDDDDDRMSLSSLSSGEDKVEVIEMNGYSASWLLGGMSQNNYLNDLMNQQNVGSLAMGCHGDVLISQADKSLEEPEFQSVLDEIIAELKLIMGKDMRKKMIENAAFKSYENWWKTSEAEEKDQNSRPATLGTDRPGGQSSSASGQQQTSLAITGHSASSASLRAPDTASTTLASLFENSDSGHFGVGGLLGLRGAMPKMPSFKKKFRPPSPPPLDGDGDEVDEDFKGPHTPEDSDNDEKEKASDESSLESDEDDNDGVIQMVKPSRRVIYSSDSSNSESAKSEEEAEEEMETGDASDAVSSEGSEDEGEELEDMREERLHSTDEEEADEDEEENEEEELDKRSCASLNLKEELDEEDSIAAKSESRPDTENGYNSPRYDREDSYSPDIPAELKADYASEDMNVNDLSDTELKAMLFKPEIEKDNQASNRTTTVKTPTDFLTVVPKVGDDGRLSCQGDMENKLVVDSGPQSSDRFETTSISDAEVDVVTVPDMLQGEDLHKAIQQPLLSPLSVATVVEHNYFSMNETTPKRARKDCRQSVSFVDEPTPATADLLLSDLPVLIPSLPPGVEIDHNYCQRFQSAGESDNPMGNEPFTIAEPLVVVPFAPVETSDALPTTVTDVREIKCQKSKLTKARSHKLPLPDITNLSGSRELAGLFPSLRPPLKPQFPRRGVLQEFGITCDFLIRGIDQEDMQFLKRRYEELLQDDCLHHDWVNYTHWVDHPSSFVADAPVMPPPPKKRKLHHMDILVSKHITGSARTEGYYKISHQEKRGYLCHARGVNQSQENELALEYDPVSQTKKKVQHSREARSESRRWQSVLGSMGEDVGDLLKFNQLKFRKKQLKFAKSGIHDWGLFALEPIQEGEMVIEYVGQVVRQSVADLREKRYEALGIGSSYLFRVDGDAIVDATKYGNLARFINHSCNPNCCAKIVTVESQKKIVIYSKRDIGVREEITYDYKFPLEEDKIRCLCGAVGCRGSLN